MAGDKLSIRDWYKYFLIASEKFLLLAVNLYNDGRLRPNARKALEIIEGLPIDD